MIFMNSTLKLPNGFIIKLNKNTHYRDLAMFETFALFA